MKTLIDDTDRKLLSLIQKDNRRTTDALGDEIGLSAAAVQRRLKRLREKGVIESEIAVLSPKATGGHMTFIVEVSLEKESVGLIDDFMRSLKESDQVQQAYYVTGEADFILIVIARDMDDFEQFTRTHFFDNANIRRFRTNVVFSRVKVGLEVPL